MSTVIKAGLLAFSFHIQIFDSLLIFLSGIRITLMKLNVTTINYQKESTFLSYRLALENTVFNEIRNW